jgi:hypothetical protein
MEDISGGNSDHLSFVLDSAMLDTRSDPSTPPAQLDSYQYISTMPFRTLSDQQTQLICPAGSSQPPINQPTLVSDGQRSQPTTSLSLGKRRESFAFRFAYAGLGITFTENFDRTPSFDPTDVASTFETAPASQSNNFDPRIDLDIHDLSPSPALTADLPPKSSEPGPSARNPLSQDPLLSVDTDLFSYITWSSPDPAAASATYTVPSLKELETTSTKSIQVMKEPTLLQKSAASNTWSSSSRATPSMPVPVEDLNVLDNLWSRITDSQGPSSSAVTPPALSEDDEPQPFSDPPRPLLELLPIFTPPTGLEQNRALGALGPPPKRASPQIGPALQIHVAPVAPRPQLVADALPPSHAIKVAASRQSGSSHTGPQRRARPKRPPLQTRNPNIEPSAPAAGSFVQTPVLNAHLGISLEDLAGRAAKFRIRYPGQPLCQQWLLAYAGQLSMHGEQLGEWRCYVIGCFHTNKRRDHILTHVGSHVNERPYQCEIW